MLAKLSQVSYSNIGSFNAVVRQGDIGLVPLMPGSPVSLSVSGAEPVTDATGEVAAGQTLCKVGLTTGRQYGPVTEIAGETVTFLATTQCGDSGGPVYSVSADGSATAVGITTGGTMGAGTVPPPCAPHIPRRSPN